MVKSNTWIGLFIALKPRVIIHIRTFPLSTSQRHATQWLITHTLKPASQLLKSQFYPLLNVAWGKESLPLLPSSFIYKLWMTTATASPGICEDARSWLLVECSAQHLARGECCDLSQHLKLLIPALSCAVQSTVF